MLSPDALDHEEAVKYAWIGADRLAGAASLTLADTKHPFFAVSPRAIGSRILG